VRHPQGQGRQAPLGRDDLDQAQIWVRQQGLITPALLDDGRWSHLDTHRRARACHLRRLRTHGLIEKIPHSNRYRVTDHGLADAMFLSIVHDRLLPTGLAELHTQFPTPIRTAARNYQHIIDTLTYTTGFAA